MEDFDAGKAAAKPASKPTDEKPKKAE